MSTERITVGVTVADLRSALEEIQRGNSVLWLSLEGVDVELIHDKEWSDLNAGRAKGV